MLRLIVFAFVVFMAYQNMEVMVGDERADAIRSWIGSDTSRERGHSTGDPLEDLDQMDAKEWKERSEDTLRSAADSAKQMTMSDWVAVVSETGEVVKEHSDRIEPHIRNIEPQLSELQRHFPDMAESEQGR